MEYRGNIAQNLGGLQDLFALLSIVFASVLLSEYNPPDGIEIAPNYSSSAFGIWTGLIVSTHTYVIPASLPSI